MLREGVKRVLQCLFRLLTVHIWKFWCMLDDLDWATHAIEGRLEGIPALNERYGIISVKKYVLNNIYVEFVKIKAGQICYNRSGARFLLNRKLSSRAPIIKLFIVCGYCSFTLCLWIWIQKQKQNFVLFPSYAWTFTSYSLPMANSVHSRSDLTYGGIN